MGRFQMLQKADVKIMGGEPTLATNPEKGRNYKRNIKMQTIWAKRRLVTINDQVRGPGWTSDRFVKFNIYNTYPQRIQTSVPRVTIITG